jgi:flagellar biosynthesis/type III secretory pathway protein FliH
MVEHLLSKHEVLNSISSHTQKNYIHRARERDRDREREEGKREGREEGRKERRKGGRNAKDKNQ